MANLLPYRILQIMPAPVGMRAKIEATEHAGRDEMPVVCLALIEEDGDTFISAMLAWNEGDIEPSERVSNFVGFLYQGETWT